jgi:2-polyprenyl-3-methyl-5-hydroxy-6-metoxy-1,4-benzoquinol methylase
MNFSERSYQPELLDNPAIPFYDIKHNMQELNTINTWLGGHAITIKGLQQLLNVTQNISPVVICEIGCGGGDNLAAIYKWCQLKKINVQLIGIDMNEHCIAFAKQQYPSFQFIVSDYKLVHFSNAPHIIFSSLFCHHFNDAELVQQLQWMRANSVFGFFINDLQRHPLAYYAIKYITKIFSGSYLVKNDAPLSVKRGFVKKEWMNIFEKAGIKKYSLTWQWAFRWLLVIKNNKAW